MVQLIQGTDILLYTGGLTETVSNVLIGEPANNGRSFTLGIPKGDTHIWTDRKLSFFGRYFRTVGFPDEGIEANIPLSWHKKVHAEYVEITGKCTVYDKQTLTRRVYDDAYVIDSRGEKTVRTGTAVADGVTVKIYSFAHDGSYIPKPGDIIVNGECDFEFDTTSEQAVSEGMATLRANGDIIVVTSARCTMNGILPDIEIIGR